MTRHPLLLVGVALVVALTGCTAASEPEPTRTSASPSPAPSPSSDGADGAPNGVFDLSCADIGPAMSAFAGTPPEAVQPTMGLISAPGWYPGPAQYMAQRAGGLACSYDGSESETGSIGWRVMIVPGAQAIIDAIAAEGYDENASFCDVGTCTLMAREGDVLLIGDVLAPELTADQTDEARRLAQGWVDRAAASQAETEFIVAESRIAGLGCEVLLPAEQLSSLWGIDALMQDEFGGWGVPAEVYYVVDGAMFCVYNSDPGGYEGEQYLMLTNLPDGAWAFELPEGREAAQVAGADAAFTGTAVGSPFVDILVGEDWIRLTGVAGSGHELIAAASAVAANVAGLP